jgi:PAS domain S-box-containing protein
VPQAGDLHKYDKTGSSSVDDAASAQNRIRAELAKERDFTAAVLQASGALVIVTDPEGRIIRSNRACEQVTGYCETELKGKTCWDVFISPQGKAATRARFETLVSKKARLAFENEWINKSGEGRQISFSNAVLMGDDGRVEYVVTTGIDITQRHQAEQELLKSEALFRWIWEASRHPMALTDQSGTILKVNEAFSAMVGKTLDAVEGWDIAALFLAEDQHSIRGYYNQHYASPGAEPCLGREFRFANGHSGAFDVSFTMVDLPGQASQLLSIYSDVTVSKRVADELARAKEAAETANRDLVKANRYLEETGRLAREMAGRAEALSSAKSEFLANMTHEIRTPLNGILGMTDLALQADLKPDQHEYIDLVRSSAEALLFLVNDVLDYSKYEAGKLALNHVEISLRTLLAEALKPLALRASLNNLRFEYVVSEDVPDHLIGDPHRLRQILMNLVSNAIKFTHAGRIAVSVHRESILGSRVALRFSVRDTGIGIPPEKHGLIFDPFTQADGSTTWKYGGTGLGLSIASGLVKMMDGRIWVESQPGQGATFYFTVTMTSTGKKVVHRPARFDVPRRGDKRNMRILLAEDNTVNQKLATHVLEREGHHVQVARSGREAIGMLQREEFDLVLMDIQMPELDGLQATAHIRQMERISGKRLPIVAMTAQTGDSDRQRCLKAGMDAYVSKPIRASELMNLIESVVPGGCFMESKTDQKSLVDVQFAHLDEALALSRVGGDFELLREVVGLFLDDYPRALEKIRNALAANDASGVEHNAHSLKGSVSTFGAKDVFEAALALEKMGRGGNLSGAQESMRTLEKALQDLRPDLEGLQGR